MKDIAYLAVTSGALLVVLTLAAPFIAEWQMRDTLVRFGAEHMAREEARLMIEDRIWGLATTFLLGIASIAAGVLVLRHKPIGWTTWLWVCSIFILLSAVDLLRTGEWLIPTVRAAWWLTMLLISLRVYKRNAYGQSWWQHGTVRT